MASHNRSLKREDCERTKHDAVFSNWEILIGSSDWANHSLGKEGVQRYRIHNLPNECQCPGLYELGVTAVPTERGRNSRKYAPEDILVVYLGQADNVRTRLQQYGRFGGHLDSGNIISSLNETEKPGLFREIFSKGCSIVFRWAPMLDKKKAEKTEAELLSVFDYAWNKVGNGACRRDEILSKLASKAKATKLVQIVHRMFRHLKHPMFDQKEGINIDSSVPIDERIGLLLPQIYKFGKSEHRFVHENNTIYEHEICGVALGDGSVCRDRPSFGTKRCKKHKGKKILGTSSVGQETTTTCGVVLEDGSFCDETPAPRRKRCELHKGRRVTEPELCIKPNILETESPFGKCLPLPVEDAFKKDDEFNICGVINIYDGSICRNMPVSRRKRCEEHKGQRVTDTRLDLGASREDASICGVVSDGYVCRAKPVTGRKRCKEHKGQRITGIAYMTNVKGYVSE